MKFLLKNKKGFTLVELIVVCVVIGILSTVIYQIFQSANRYNGAIEKVSQQQSLCNDMMYRLRVELASAAQAEAFDPSVNPEKMDFTDSANDEYYYIVQNNQDNDGDGFSDGGFLLYGFDSAGNRVTTPTVYGAVNTKEKQYSSSVIFTTTDNGRLQVTVQVKDVNASPADAPIYKLSTDVNLRSVAANGVTKPAIRFKNIS